MRMVLMVQGMALLLFFFVNVLKEHCIIVVLLLMMIFVLLLFFFAFLVIIIIVVVIIIFVIIVALLIVLIFVVVVSVSLFLDGFKDETVFAFITINFFVLFNIALFIIARMRRSSRRSAIRNDMLFFI
mmetsp:Transcript_63996/g.183941  ORF Transcript_63996/g.183941 Transcript_63996/m.183941 type:complete len:128 (+) Transcript_63996:50-433(+)